MKAKDKTTGQFKKVYVKALDGMPVGSEIDYSGNISDIPTGWEQIDDPNVYSTTQEIDTGKTLDGKKIYRSYISFTHSSTGNYTYNHNLGIETLVSANIFLSVAGQTISSHGYRPNPYISGSNAFMVSQVTQNTIVSQATGWSNNTVYAWLEYTKTS